MEAVIDLPLLEVAAGPGSNAVDLEKTVGIVVMPHRPFDIGTEGPAAAGRIDLQTETRDGRKPVTRDVGNIVRQVRAKAKAVRKGIAGRERVIRERILCLRARIKAICKQQQGQGRKPEGSGEAMVYTLHLTHLL